MPLEVDDALPVRREHGRVLDVPLERHVTVDQPQCLADPLPRDAATDGVQLGGESMQFRTVHRFGLDRDASSVSNALRSKSGYPASRSEMTRLWLAGQAMPNEGSSQRTPAASSGA